MFDYMSTHFFVSINSSYVCHILLIELMQAHFLLHVFLDGCVSLEIYQGKVTLSILLFSFYLIYCI